MPYVKIIDGIVVDRDTVEKEGYIKVPDSVKCGMVQQGDAFVVPAASAQFIKDKNLAAATKALQKSDVQIIRCAENGIAVPDAWKTYRSALRAIIALAGDGVIPDLPAYP